MTLLAGQAVPSHGFNGILRHSGTKVVTNPEVGLRLGVASLGAGAEVCKGLCGRLFILYLHRCTEHRKAEDGNRDGR